MDEFSVIIVNWNGRHLLGDCLGSLRKQTFRDFEVILVDNGSHDGSVEFVRQDFPEVEIIALPQNLGFCGGNNEGIRRSRGEWVILLNNDTEIVPEYVEAIHRAILTFPQAGMFASKILFADSGSIIDNCGLTVSRAGTAQEIGRNERDVGQYDLSLQPFGPSGGAGVYRRAMLDQIGLLDEDFFCIYEDCDLAVRARLHGFPCHFVPDAVVHHKYRSTLARRPDWQVYYAQRNIEFVYLTTMPAALILRYGALHLLYNFGSCLYFARKGLLRPFLSAKWQVMRRLPRLWRKRRTVQRNRAVSTSEFNKLLAGNWFLNRVRKGLDATGLPARQRYGNRT